MVSLYGLEGLGLGFRVTIDSHLITVGLGLKNIYLLIGFSVRKLVYGLGFRVLSQYP